MLAALAFTLLKPLAFLFFVVVQHVGAWPISAFIWTLALWLTFR